MTTQGRIDAHGRLSHAQARTDEGDRTRVRTSEFEAAKPREVLMATERDADTLIDAVFAVADAIDRVADALEGRDGVTTRHLEGTHGEGEAGTSSESETETEGEARHE
jgi:hypothetical protein